MLQDMCYQTLWTNSALYNPKISVHTFNSSSVKKHAINHFMENHIDF